MERSYDEVIADMLIQVNGIERRMERADHRMIRADIKAKENYHRLCREFIDLWSKNSSA